MSPPRALIAEDEPLLQAALKADLQGLWPELDVVACVEDGPSAVSQALALRPQLCFLDIRMPGCSGLEAAQALAEDWPDDTPFPLLVFVTAYDQFAVQAFEAQAVDYLIKPVQPERLLRCVQRLQQRLAATPSLAAAGPTLPAATLDTAVAQLRALLGAAGLATPGASTPRSTPAAWLEWIPAGVGHQVQMVAVGDVIYFEAADKYVRVVTATREHLIRLPLKDLLPQLDPQRFWQVHRGTVVQVACIAHARREESGKVSLSLRDRPETLSASRLYAHLFKAW